MAKLDGRPRFLAGLLVLAMFGRDPAIGADFAPAPLGPVRTLSGGPIIARSVAISEDGSTVAAGDGAGLVRAWGVDAARPAREFRGRIRSADAVALAADGRRVALAGPTTIRVVPDPKGLFDPVSYLEGAAVDVWDVPTGRVLAGFEAPGATTALAFDAGGRSVAAACLGDRMGLARYAIEGGPIGPVVGGPCDERRGMQLLGLGGRAAFARDLGRAVAVEMRRGGALRWFDLEAGRAAAVDLEAGHANVCGVALAPDGGSVAAIDAEQTLTAWSTGATKARKVVRLMAPRTEVDPGPFPTMTDARTQPLVLAYSPAGDRIVAGVADGTLLVIDARSLILMAIVRGPVAPIRALAFRGDRIRVVAGGWQVPINVGTVAAPLLVWDAGPSPRP